MSILAMPTVENFLRKLAYKHSISGPTVLQRNTSRLSLWRKYIKVMRTRKVNGTKTSYQEGSNVK
eukprot:1097702-Pleurochrysis_carterae.AAC.22